MEDKEAAPFEFAIRANEEELSILQKKFEHLSDEDEAAMVHFIGRAVSSGDHQANGSYAARLKDIYAYLHELGTAETKKHIEDQHFLS